MITQIEEKYYELSCEEFEKMIGAKQLYDNH